MKYYAGIGARNTPIVVQNEMFQIAEELAKMGYILRSGGAAGADTAFENGCDFAGGKKEIFLPWQNFNNNDSVRYMIPTMALQIAELYHPRWDTLKPGAKKLMARNCMQLLGQDLNVESKSDFIICWTKDGKIAGGTGQSMRMVEAYKIPVYNLATQSKSDIMDYLYDQNHL